MSCKQILDQFEHLRYCPICKQEFNDARLIRCGHTFCLQCIEPLLHKCKTRFADKTTTLTCPLCSKVCDVPKAGVSDFPSIVMANQVKTAFEEVGHMKNRILCVLCERIISDPICCKQCKEYFCDECAKQHQLLFSDHILTSSAECPVAQKCKIHCNQFVSHVCTQCMEAVCPLCATKHHSNKINHTVMTMDQAKEHLVAQTGQQIQKLEKNRVDVDELLAGIDQRFREEEHQYISEKRRIGDAAKKCHSMIEQEENDLLCTIQNRYEENSVILQEAKQNILSKWNTLDESINLVKNALKSLEKDSLLQSLDERVLSWSKCLPRTEDDDAQSELELKTYNFIPCSSQRNIGVIEPESPILTRMDLLKSMQFADEDYDNNVDLSSLDSETRIKEIYISVPKFLTEHLITSGVDGATLTMVGVGLDTERNVVCAINAHKVGQVILSHSSSDQQVIYHRRKEISAFAVSDGDKCGVSLVYDNHVSILSLLDLQEDREAICQTHRHSCNKSKSSIQAIAFNENEEIIISDSERNTVTCFDSRWRRPFNITGTIKNSNKTFDNAAAITVGPGGEIIVFDNMKKNLVIFKSDTKYSKTISLDKLSSSCCIACHSSAVVFVADCKMSCVVKVDIDCGSVQEVLNAESGIKTPSCISVKGNLLAVSNSDSVSTAYVKVYSLSSE